MSNRHSSAVGIARGGLVAIVLSGLAAGNLDAAMAPAYERVREFGLVMSAANAAAAMLAPHGPIDRIERAGDGTFRFRAGHCFQTATLVPVPADESPPAPGTPTGYRVSLGDVRCE